MVIRTYFDKTNTIVVGEEINTGKNPVAELFYGTNTNGDNSYSRFLFHFNLNKIEDYYNDGTLTNNNVKHTLKLVNTGSLHTDLLNKVTGDGKKRTSSFDLVLFEIPQDWDEGVGYDYHDTIDTKAVLSHQPSNWFKSTTNSAWAEEGVINPSTLQPIDTIHFSDGNEDLEIDITTLINQYLIEGKQNYGLGIAFAPEFEGLKTSDGLQYVGFFTRHTQTFFEPCLVTTKINHINDDRDSFYSYKTNKLYLYVNSNGVPSNLDDETGVTVDILDEMGGIVHADQVITKESKGVYSVEVSIEKDINGIPSYYSDVWKNISIGGRTKDIVMYFELKDDDNFFKTGSETFLPKDYTIKISGLKHNERIKRGDVRKIFVNALVPYTVNEKVLLDTIEYRLFIKQGVMEHTVIDYNSVEKTFDNNYFMLDTDSLLPQQYFLDIKMVSGGEVKTTKELIQFEIVG